MNTVVIKQGIGQIVDNMTIGKPLAFVGLVGLLAYPPTRGVVLTGLSDAYFQVSVFVAATLLGLLYFERVKSCNLADILRKNPNKQVFMAACFGAIPGCGGAIIIITQYVRGTVSFASVVAVLTATMGDAAFLLLAKAPAAALLIFGICFVVGVAFGYLVERVHGQNFLRVQVDYNEEEDRIEENPLLSPCYRLWLILFLPGAVIGLATAMQVDINEVFSIGGVSWASSFGAACALMAITMWTFNPMSDIRLYADKRRELGRRVVDTTNFITFWVLCGFVAYGILESVFQINLAAAFQTWLYWIPLVATLIGFIPGCGPQIVVTTLFLNGIIPLSAQLANAISNDGDALFPAVAIAPRAALLATLYTSVPALVVGYGWMFLFE